MSDQTIVMGWIMRLLQFGFNVAHELIQFLPRDIVKALDLANFRIKVLF
jgi:hypothetical protein